MRGVAYRIEMRRNDSDGHGRFSHIIWNHKDRAEFVLGPRASSDKMFRDHVWLDSARPGSESDEKSWRCFSRAVVASAAFPVGLRARVFERDPKSYDRRTWPVPLDQPINGAHVKWSEITATWAEAEPPSYQYVNIDGGTLDNEPMEEARRWLARDSPNGRNPRDGDKATQVVLMIDPLTRDGPME